MADKSNPTPQGAGETEQPKKSLFKQISGSLIQMVFFWFIMKMLTGGFNKTETTVPQPSSPSTQQQQQQQQQKASGAFQLRDYASVPENIYYFPNPLIPTSDLPDAIAPLWQTGVPLDVSIYVSENEYFEDYAKTPDVKSTGIQYGEWFDGKEYSIDVRATESMQNNGTVYAHIFVTHDGVPIDPLHPAHVPDMIVYQRHGIVLYNFKT
ncbi:hypothetical protein G6F56_009970 [Rhizopus delemar]|nr:hypothetical protein G6F56_009970 [Rhizopus delemar]